MKYDFTTQVSRENTGSSKWDGMYAANPNVPEGTDTIFRSRYGI